MQITLVVIGADYREDNELLRWRAFPSIFSTDSPRLSTNDMPTTYRIHPGIGIARLGNSPDVFCISPEQPAALPIDCDAHGNPSLSPDGMTELPIKTFKDEEGRIKRQAARFQIWAYDEEHPKGRPLKLGRSDRGRGERRHARRYSVARVPGEQEGVPGTNSASSKGEHGYDPSHPPRNAAITDEGARQRLIIDPGPRTVTKTEPHGAI